jgi:signal transduction histidine kinase
MRPINRLTQAMQCITQKELNLRLPADSEDKEFEILIAAYNDMLDRLERSFQQASRFSADAAHELKTPLTILRGRIEHAVAQSDPSLLDINGLLDEVGTLSAITRKLLLLSQADAGTLAIERKPIDITQLLEEMFEDIELVNDSITWSIEVQAGLAVKGDVLLLRQLINNLLSNAIRYHIPETPIQVTATSNLINIEIVIINQCHHLEDHERLQIFKRFYRGKLASEAAPKGSGLGLSLSLEIARAHNGELTLLGEKADEAKFRLLLPK